MSARDEGRAIPRRGLLGGMVAATALGLPGERLIGATAGPPDEETIERLTVALDDAPTEEFGWGTLNWLINAERMPGAEQTVGIARIFSGQRNPVHYHPNCEEVLYMIAGRGRHSLGEEAIELTPGMAIRIPRDVPHNLVNTGEETILCLVTFSSGDRQTVFMK